MKRTTGARPAAAERWGGARRLSPARYVQPLSQACRGGAGLHRDPPLTARRPCPSALLAAPVRFSPGGPVGPGQWGEKEAGRGGDSGEEREALATALSPGQPRALRSLLISLARIPAPFRRRVLSETARNARKQAAERRAKKGYPKSGCEEMARVKRSCSARKGRLYSPALAGL